jgi:hypothetical protein
MATIINIGSKIPAKHLSAWQKKASSNTIIDRAATSGIARLLHGRSSPKLTGVFPVRQSYSPDSRPVCRALAEIIYVRR